MRADLTRNTPVSTTNALRSADAVGDARQQAFQRSIQTLLGKSVQGTVQARLSDGSSLVKIGDTSARMMLPPGAQVGANVAMTLVALNPRPTFQISSDGNATTLAYAEAIEDGPAGALRANGIAASLLDKAAAATRSLPLAAGESDPELSTAARLINTLLTKAESGPNPPQSIVGSTPLMAASTTGTAPLTQALQDAIGQSGLFYESHVAEWAEGKRSLSELLREPQMQKPIVDADLAAAQLINLQLRTQEQDKIRWQGEAWPGQKMEWEIDKDAPDDQEDGTPAQQTWRSGVRFRFPLLGEVAASVVLIGDALHIQIQADTPESAAALRSRTGALQQSLKAAGATLSSLTINLQGDAALAGDNAPANDPLLTDQTQNEAQIHGGQAGDVD
jgi:hypothetical protein